jgi:4-amino-4-deoxy-L-arabinose transferase-like glycosyltransferase
MIETQALRRLDASRATYFPLLDSSRAIYVVVALGLLLRIVPLAMVGGRYLAHENPSYDVMAQQLIGHVKFSPYWPPGLPYYLAVFHEIFGSGMLVARASILVLYAGFSFALYALVKELSSRRAGNLAALAFALYPSYIRYAFNPSTEYPTVVCLLLIAYLTILIVRKHRYALSPVLGLVLGALALIRANSLGLAIAVPVYLLFRTKKFSVAFVPLLMASLLVSAWLWKAYDLTGRFVMINDSNEENFVFANHPDTPLMFTSRGGPVEPELPPKFVQLEHEIDAKPSPAQQRVLREATLRYILSRPDLFLLRCFNRFCAYFTFPVHHAEPLVGRSGAKARIAYWLGNGITLLDVAFFWPIMVLAIVFCFNLPSFPGQAGAIFPIIGVALIYAAPCWLTWSQPRYAFPVIPLRAVFAFVLLDAFLRRPWRQVLAPVLRSAARRRAMLLAVAFFFCIQIEWIVLILSWGTRTG